MADTDPTSTRPNQPDPSWLSIGQFSTQTRISVRMLRHYDRHHVLTPAWVDQNTGYRWYTPDQVGDARLIRQLRDVGFNVSAMAALLAVRTPILVDALQAQREVLQHELRTSRERLATIDRMLDDLRGTPMTNIEVRRDTIPAMTVITLRGTVPTYSDEGTLWQQMMPELAAQGITPIGPGGVFEHDPTYVEADPDLSIWLPVAPGTTASTPLTVTDLPTQDAVIARVQGPYSLISRAHDKIGDHIAEHGLSEAEKSPDSLTGLVMNVYLTDPSSEVDESEYLSEVHRPLAG